MASDSVSRLLNAASVTEINEPEFSAGPQYGPVTPVGAGGSAQLPFLALNPNPNVALTPNIAFPPALGPDGSLVEADEPSPPPSDGPGPDPLGLAPELLDLLQQPRQKPIMVRLERELIAFVRDSSRNRLVFPPTIPFYRMMVHKVAEHFRISHFVGESESGERVVVLDKNPSTYIPPVRFAQYCEREAPSKPAPVPEPKMIMRRAPTGQQSGDAQRAGNKDSREDCNADGLTAEEVELMRREVEYEAMRARIFNSAHHAEDLQELRQPRPNAHNAQHTNQPDSGAEPDPYHERRQRREQEKLRKTVELLNNLNVSLPEDSSGPQDSQQGPSPSPEPSPPHIGRRGRSDGGDEHLYRRAPRSVPLGSRASFEPRVPAFDPRTGIQYQYPPQIQQPAGLAPSGPFAPVRGVSGPAALSPIDSSNPNPQWPAPFAAFSGPPPPPAQGFSGGYPVDGGRRAARPPSHPSSQSWSGPAVMAPFDPQFSRASQQPLQPQQPPPPPQQQPRFNSTAPYPSSQGPAPPPPQRPFKLNSAAAPFSLKSRPQGPGVS